MTQMMTQNLCDTAKAVLRGSLQQFKKQEKPQMNNLTPKVTRERKTKPKVSKGKKS